jgi:hypothetical protein
VCRPYARGMARVLYWRHAARVAVAAVYWRKQPLLPSHLTTGQGRCVIRHYVPNMPALSIDCGLLEATHFAGLRKAGMPEE